VTNKRVFEELELSILKIFKDQDKLTVRDVLDILGGKDKYTTVMTVMNRLVEKKQLIRQRHGQHYLYWINESSKTSPSLLNKLKQKIFGGKAASMLNYLIDSENDITDNDLAEMEKLIQEIRQSRQKP